MDAQSREILRGSVDSVVRVTCRDSEVLTARVLFMLEAEGCIIFDLLETSRPDKYERHDVQPAYMLRFDDIERVSKVA